MRKKKQRRRRRREEENKSLAVEAILLTTLANDLRQLQGQVVRFSVRLKEESNRQITSIKTLLSLSYVTVNLSIESAKKNKKTISISLWGKSPLKVYYNHFPKCGQASIGPNIHETQIEGTRDIVQVKTKRDGGGDKQGQRRITAPFSTTLNINSSCTQLELDQQTRKKRKRRKKTRFFLSKKSV